MVAENETAAGLEGHAAAADANASDLHYTNDHNTGQAGGAAWRRRYRPIAELSDAELAAAREQTAKYLLLARVTGVYSLPALLEILDLARELEGAA